MHHNNFAGMAFPVSEILLLSNLTEFLFLTMDSYLHEFCEPILIN